MIEIATPARRSATTPRHASRFGVKEDGDNLSLALSVHGEGMRKDDIIWGSQGKGIEGRRASS